MMIVNFILFTIIGIIIQALYSHSWGDIGHHTTAAIAQQYLTQNTLNKINKILSTYQGPDKKTFKSIIEIATYPDEIRPLIPWAECYHFLDMHANETRYNEETQCKPPTYCIIKALQNYTTSLLDPSIKDSSRLGEALAFVVHLMGDIHQPLHAGNVEDHGGNDISLIFSNEWNINDHTSNLHWLWDHLMIVHYMNTELKTTDLNYLYKMFIYLIEANPIFKEEYLTRIPNFIKTIEDSRFYSNFDIYETISNYDHTNVSIKYYNDYWPLVRMQIMKSGLQMARLLNDVFD